MASKGVGKTPSSREVEAFSQKAHLIFLVILQAASLYASQSSQFIDFALSNWLVLVHSLVALVIPLVLYVLMTKLLRKIRSFNFLLESQSALWSTSIVILHPTFAHRTLGITQYYILIIMGFAVYLLSQKEKENAENTAKQSIKSTHFIAFLVILAIFAGFTTHPGISFVGSVCLSAWLQGYMNIDVPKVVQYVATGLSLTLWTCQHFQLLPSTQHIAPQCETFMDYFNHFILYLINFGNKLVGFCLPINLFTRDFHTNLFIDKKDTAFDIAEKLWHPYDFFAGWVQYVVFAKESKHIKLQKTNNKLPNLFNQDDGNVFFTEVWVVFCLIVIVIALKNVLMALWKQKKQPSLWKKLPQQKSILFVIMLLLSFDSIHQSWQFDSKFLSLEDVYSSGFDVSAVLFGVELGIIIVDSLFSSCYEVNGKDRDYDVVNAVNKTRNIVMIAKPVEGSQKDFEVYCPKNQNFISKLSKGLHVAAVLTALFLISRTV